MPTYLGTRWHTWISGLPILAQVHVPRWLSTSGDGNSQTHAFCDVSDRAYGAAIYVRTTRQDSTLVRLACSKNRLAPVKKVTPPKLEILATLVGTRLLSYFCEATGYDITRATLWTDSTVALSWIRSDPNRWISFVCNRVAEIQSHTSPTQWKYCPGQKNSTDYHLSGRLGNQMQSLDTWWHGPSWFRNREVLAIGSPRRCRITSRGEKGESSSRSDKCEPHRRVKIQLVLEVDSYHGLVPSIPTKLAEKGDSAEELTRTELEAARMYWVRVVQREILAPELEALRRNSALPSSSKIAR